MKKTLKGLALAAILSFGFSYNANAQGFLDFLNKAAETVSRGVDTYNNVRNSVDQTREAVDSYKSRNEPRVVGSVTMYWATKAGTFTSADSGSKRADIIEKSDGTKEIKMGGQTYWIHRNKNYDPDSYEHDYMYEYYIMADKTYRFNM